MVPETEIQFLAYSGFEYKGKIVLSMQRYERTEGCDGGLSLINVFIVIVQRGVG